MRRVAGNTLLVRTLAKFAVTGIIGTFVVTPVAVDRAWAVDVAFQMPAAVSTSGATSLTVTLTPSPSGTPVVLTVRSLLDNGNASFLPGNQREMTLTQTTTLQLLGSVPSTWEGNMVLTAAVAGTVVAAERFTVVDPTMLPRARARQIAQELIAQREIPDPGAPVTVALWGSKYVARFYELKELGGYEALVVLDAVTGIRKPPVEVVE